MSLPLGSTKPEKAKFSVTYTIASRWNGSPTTEVEDFDNLREALVELLFHVGEGRKVKLVHRAG